MPRKAKVEGNGDGVAAPVPIDDPPPGPQPSREAAEPDDRPNMPCHVVRFGLVRACIWLNRTDQRPRHNVTVSRLYRGSDDHWHSTGSFGYRDLLALAKCLDWAHTYISEQIASADVPF